MKVLQVIPGLNNDSGPTQVVLNLSNELLKLGIEVEIYCIEGRGRDLDVKISDKIKITSCKTTFLKNWAFSIQFWNLIRDNVSNFDIIHVHSIWLFTNIPIWLFAKRKNKKYIIRPAGSLEPWAINESGFKKQLYFQLIEKRIINSAAAIHSASDKETANLEAFNFDTPIIKIPNGISIPSPKQNTGFENEVKSEEFVVLFLGRIAPVKNLEFLLEVLLITNQKLNTLKVIIAGPIKDKYSQSIKDMYHASGLNVQFTGSVNGPEKRNLFSQAHVFILPSLSENFAIAIAEALAEGIPVIASNNTPWTNLELKGAGFCLPLDVNKFTDAILQIWKDGKQKYSENARAFSLEFSWKEIAKMTVSTYEKILNE